MIRPATMDFLRQLNLHNEKAWFEEHKASYAAAKTNFEQFIGELLEKLAGLEPAFREQKAKDCIFRIFRDVRFSKDKTPYKSHFGGYLSKGGKKSAYAGFYLHIEPGKSFAGGGLWMPEASVLKKVRQEIDYNFETLQPILAAKSFQKYFGSLTGERLKTTPKGYDAHHEAIEFLKMKSFIADHSFTDKEVTDENFVSNCKIIFTVMNPLIKFLNDAME